SEGAKVVAADLLEDAVKEIAGGIGDDAIGVGFEASDADSVQDLIERSVKHFGRIDILHNNHAKQDREMMEDDLNALNTSFELWDETMAVNLRGYFATCKFAI